MLNIVLWLSQILMALLFGLHGRTLLFLPDPVPEPMGWVHDVWGPFRIFIGLAEVAAAVALLVPGIARRLRPEGSIARFTILTPMAAGGLAFVMVSAFVFHALRGETANLPFNLVLALLLLALGWLRWKKAPL